MIENIEEKNEEQKSEDIYEQMDREIEKISNSSVMTDIRKDIYEDTEKMINGFDISFKIKNNEDYEKELKNKLKAFVEEIDRKAFRRDGTLVDDVKSICKKVVRAFGAIKIGNTENAEKIVEEILEEYQKNPLAVSEVNKSYAFRGIAPFDQLRKACVPKENYEKMMTGELNFFRARVVDSTKKISCKNEINYLGYSKRDLAGDMRFSSKGKICLYLGSTSYVCSKECRWYVWLFRSMMSVKMMNMVD